MPVPRRNKTAMHPWQGTLPSIQLAKEASMQKSYGHFYMTRCQVEININGNEMAVSKQSSWPIPSRRMEKLLPKPGNQSHLN